MTAQPDYTQMAQSMLQMWQDHWKNFSAVMHQTAPQSTPHTNVAPETNFTTTDEKPDEKPKENTGANPSASTIEGMEQWQRFMASWAQTTSSAAEQRPEPAAAEEKNEPRETSHSEPEARPAASATPATAAHEQRDVLFIELTRRVEFLHERVVKLESELEKLKRRSI